MIKNNKQYLHKNIGGFTANFMYMIIPLYIIILSFFIILLYTDLNLQNENVSEKFEITHQNFTENYDDSEYYLQNKKNDTILNNIVVKEISQLIKDNFNLFAKESNFINKKYIIFKIPKEEIFTVDNKTSEKMVIFIKKMSILINNNSSLKLEIIFKLSDDDYDKNNLMQLENIALLCYENINLEKHFLVSVVGAENTEKNIYIKIQNQQL